MPKYTFKCKACQKEKQHITACNVTKVHCSECGADAYRQMPRTGLTKVTETVDSFTNVKQEEDANLKREARRTEYFWDVEVPRLVQTYSTQTCLEEGWLIYNEKGELVINKPPSKR